MTYAPLVSIIVPSFNQGRFIRETIDSILSQDYRPIEVLVFDGGSTDETVSVLESYEGVPELQWWSAPDKGVVDAVNKGFEKATGEIVAIQSSDDGFLPGALRFAVAALVLDPAIGLVYGDVEYIDESSRKIGRTELPAFSLKAYVGKTTFIPQPSAFFRATALRAVGSWREEVSYAADAEFWLRIALQFRVVKLDRLFGRYRYHGAQRDVEGKRVARDWEQVARSLMRNSMLSSAEKRAARAGIHLTWHHYTPETKWRTRTARLYLAAISNPAALLTSEFPKKELLPGREPIWKLLSRIKRGLGFKARAP